MTVAQALHQARASGVDRLDAQLILAGLLAGRRSWLVAHDDAVLTPHQAEAMRTLCARRTAGEPLAYLLGEHEFHGLALKVDSNVLVPRPETELLVDWAIELLAGLLAAPVTSAMATRPRVVDLGTGSGAIALAVKRAHPAATLLATDCSPAALNVARANAARHGLDIEFVLSSWWAGLPARRFELALANPPYIASGDPHLPALRHEPLMALTSGANGLTALREIIDSARDHLAPGGWLLLEHGYDQAEAVQDLLRNQRFDEIQTRIDLGGQARCTAARGGRKPTPSRQLRRA